MSEMTQEEYIKVLEEENKKLREDAAQIFIEELVINGNGMDASLQNMPFTQVMAEWGRQMFQSSKTDDWTPNFLTLDFGLAGEEHYTMTIKRASANSPEKMAIEYKLQRDNIMVELEKLMNSYEGLVEEEYSNTSLFKEEMNPVEEARAFIAKIKAKS